MNNPGVGMVHLGPGAFFRAFGAVYTQDAVEASGGDWGIIGVSLRSPTIRDMLGAENFDYTSVSMSPAGMEPRRITVLQDVLVAPENPEAVLVAMSDPAIRIVSLTVTEKGYCYVPSTGQLDPKHPDIEYDLKGGLPRSAIGFIVAALARRRNMGHRPFTVLSCDNLPDNGALLRRVVLEFAGKLDTDLADWIAHKARFPATMVDRITPATSDQDIAALRSATGIYDPACVAHEPFRQWVIEDSFVDGAHPDWAAGGAQFVKDVAPFEMMKLRALNGTHSALAYLGYLAGFETIADTVASPEFVAYLDYLWSDEILPSIPTPPGTELDVYARELMARYQNPNIRHRTWQIAMDGSQKLPQRLLGTVADNLKIGRPVGGLALAVAAWMRYVGGTDERGAPIDVRDPIASELNAASDGAQAEEDKVAALLDERRVFDVGLAQNPHFRAAVIAAYERLATGGALVAVRGFNQ